MDCLRHIRSSWISQWYVSPDLEELEALPKNPLTFDLGFAARNTRNEKPRPFSNGSTYAVTSNTGIALSPEKGQGSNQGSNYNPCALNLCANDETQKEITRWLKLWFDSSFDAARRAWGG